MNIKNDTKKMSWQAIIDNDILTETKVEIARHKAKHKVIIGGKGTGKTFIPEVKAIMMFETNNYFNAMGFRHDKDKATTKLSGYFHNAVSLLKRKKMNITTDYEFRTNKSYKIEDKRVMNNNQKFEYGSLQDITGSTDGLSPNKAGYFGLCLIDEPINKNSIEKNDIPTDEQWEEDMKIISDNLDRWAFDMKAEMGNIPKVEYWYLMNDWGKHPLSVAVDKVLPEDDFIMWVLQYPLVELFGNKELLDELFADPEWKNNVLDKHTKQFYDEKADTLYVRMTKFANPINCHESAVKTIFNDLYKALLTENKNALTISLGLRHEGRLDNDMLVFNIDFKDNIKTLDELLESGYEKKEITYGVDIDTSRVMTIAPTYLLQRKTPDPLEGTVLVEEALYVDRIMEFKANGTGVDGSKNDIYVDYIAKLIKNHIENNKNFDIKKNIVVDDNRKMYMNSLMKLGTLPSTINWYQAVKNGKAFDIIPRQDKIEVGFNEKVIFIHPDNKDYMNDIKVCQKADIHSPKRKTTGTTNYLDRIDAVEYSTQPYSWKLLELVPQTIKQSWLLEHGAESEK